MHYEHVPQGQTVNHYCCEYTDIL